MLVGYGEENGQKYWLVRNSWSASWGEAGYIRLHRGDDEETNCGSDITPWDGSACAGEIEPVTACNAARNSFISSISFSVRISRFLVPGEASAETGDIGTLGRDILSVNRVTLPERSLE